MKIGPHALGCLLAVIVSGAAHAAAMDFQGLQDGERPGDFYNGGAGSRGSVGGPQRDFGVTFSGNSLVRCNIAGDCASRQQDALVFNNQPALAAAADPLNFFVNVEGGFTGDISMTFATIQTGLAELWSGASGTGELLGVIDLEAGGCPDLDHCAFRNAGGALAMGQIAHSISFTGVSGDFFAIDNLAFELADSPISAAPEPAAWALMTAGFGLAGAGLRRRRRGALA